MDLLHVASEENNYSLHSYIEHLYACIWKTTICKHIREWHSSKRLLSCINATMSLHLEHVTQEYFHVILKWIPIVLKYSSIIPFLHGRGILVLMNKALTKKNKKNTRNKSSHSLICYIASHVCNCLIVHWDWGVDHTIHLWHHPPTSRTVIVWKVVDQHLFFNTIPDNFTPGIWRANGAWGTTHKQFWLPDQVGNCLICWTICKINKAFCELSTSNVVFNQRVYALAA